MDVDTGEFEESQPVEDVDLNDPAFDLFPLPSSFHQASQSCECGGLQENPP